MIKLFKASSFKYTPFGDFEEGDMDCLNAHGIYITENVTDADVVISQNMKHLKKHFWRVIQGKRFLIWTTEPRFDICFGRIESKWFGIVKVHIMNIYTKDVFLENITIHAKMMDKVLPLLPLNFKLGNRKIAALMSYYKGVDSPPLLYQGSNIDLISVRSKIALRGYELGVLDIYGKGWGKGIAKEDSREGNWPDRKREILSPYAFNLCFENTAFPNYMTEKIWGSIEEYCLPIYYGKHTNAYDIFPENSFIDYAEFKTPDELFDYISKMSDEEYVERMNKCLEAYNSIALRGAEYPKQLRKEMLLNIVNRLALI